MPGQPVWDLCCDHGYLGLSALHLGEFSEVVFNDVVEHVLQDLRKSLSVDSCARIICGPAEAISEPLVGNVVIAGVGGEKITKILNAHLGYGRLRASRILLCPEKDAEWLGRQSFAGYTLAEAFTIPHGRGVRWIYRFESDCQSGEQPFK